MNEHYRVSALMLSVLLMGCSPPAPANSETGTPQPPKPAVSQPSVQGSSQGQQLPITAQTQIAGQTIDLEVAQTPQQQAIGLMYRSSLPANQGMLFPFDPPRSVSFWMKNVEINLDMLFLKDGEVKAIAENVPPCTTTPCPTYGPNDTLIDQVIELRGGRASELGIQVGDRISVEFLER